MKLVQETFIADGRFICQREAIWHNDGQALLQHQAFCCPRCGEIWGRRIYQSDLDWNFNSVKCRLHGGGSLLSDYALEHALAPDDYYAPYYPTELLAYELKLELFKGDIK